MTDDRLREGAKRIYEDPTFKEVLDAKRDELKDAWARASVADKEGRDGLFMLVKALDMVENAFKKYSGTDDEKLAAYHERHVNPERNNNA